MPANVHQIHHRQRALSNYDAFLDTLDSYGLQDVLSVYSAATNALITAEAKARQRGFARFLGSRPAMPAGAQAR
jgi:hypothetical protein